MPTPNQKTNIFDLLIPLLALGLITFGIGSYGLYEPHESHFAMVGNEMIWRGDWVTPYLNGAPYLNKPPLLYWLIAISTTFFGNSEFAARLPIAFAGWLGIIIAGQWSKELWGVTANRMTVLMLSVTLGWFIFSHQILTDILLATLVLSSNYFLWKILYKPQSWIYFFCLYSSIALCLLTKGLIGVFLIFCSYIAIALYHGNWELFKKTKLLIGIVFILALVLPWCIAIEKANPGFWHYFIVNEHLERILDRRLPPDYVVSKISSLGYLGITAIWCFPWTIFLPTVVKFVWQHLKINNKERNSLQDAILLLTVACILPLVIFIPLSSRLIYYSIPAIPIYIILCTGALYEQFKIAKQQKTKPYWFFKDKFNRSFNLYGIVLNIIGLITLGAIVFLPKLFTSFTVIKNYSIVTSLVAAIILAFTLGFLLAGIELLNQNYLLSFKSLVISLFFVYGIASIGFTLYQDVRSSKNLVAIVENRLPVGTLWIFEGSREIGAAAGLSYYLNQGTQINQTKELINDNQELPVGLVPAKGTKIYRHVLVLEDGGKNRTPPQFPGDKPNYLIDKQQLQTYWNSMRPVVFVTDFLRDFNDPQDPIEINLPENANRSLLSIGRKQVYLNQAAIRILSSL